MLELNSKTANELRRVLEKKITQTEWVIENKSLKNTDQLLESINLQKEILEKVDESLEETEKL